MLHTLLPRPCHWHPEWTPEHATGPLSCRLSARTLSGGLLKAYWAAPAGCSPKGDMGVSGRRVLGPRGSCASAFMCDIAIDMPEVVRDGPIGVLATERGLSGLGDTCCEVLKCAVFLSSSASNCGSTGLGISMQTVILAVKLCCNEQAVPHMQQSKQVDQPVKTGTRALACLWRFCTVGPPIGSSAHDELSQYDPGRT